MTEIVKHKYPKTAHFPWTEASTSDDKILTRSAVEEHFMPMEDAYASLKLDGENTTIGHGYSHARSMDSKSHWSRNHIKQLTANLKKDIEPNWRICGENMLAVHSIRYNNLEAFFYVFAVWDATNTRLSLDAMIEYTDFLGLKMAPILGRGPFKTLDFKNNFGLDFTRDEGYVVANANSFHQAQMIHNAAKMVRNKHVQESDDHWFSKPIDKNVLINTPVDVSTSVIR